ncbi:unnamed protein product [Acanthoscelides obtectus]|uniref:Uncharacterized protein n=1 Tax=Acanthoscelides obtectus TaxID=200917 RepID=A0A9P0NYR5_ACAOB|nr:unnamed protein product [Acanthoscelides obtectus]CAK1633945.1 hypothetical protein AOBTE_LOCUS8499 [Acanthoscelides obtectus]
MVDLSDVPHEKMKFHPCDTPRENWQEIQKKMMAVAKSPTKESPEAVSLYIESSKASEESMKEIPIVKHYEADTTSYQYRVSDVVPSNPSDVCAAVVEEIVQNVDRTIHAKDQLELVFRGKSGDSDRTLNIDMEDLSWDSLSIDTKEESTNILPA